MRLLDIFCGAGGSAAGYARAGFEVTGVDIAPQPRYPYAFILGDALDYARTHGHEYDAIHASPPCQRYSQATPNSHKANHPDLIEPTREVLTAIGRPYVIENVPGASRHLQNPVRLCGSMFGLPLRRHRYFEIVPMLPILTPQCDHSRPIILITGTRKRKGQTAMEYTMAQCSAAAGINWMTRKEIDQAIPPAYTHFIGCHLMIHLLKQPRS